MRIRFGINENNEILAIVYACNLMCLTIVQTRNLHILETSQETVFKLRMPNVTSIYRNLYCVIPYSECHCSSVSAEYCLTDKHIKRNRSLPLIAIVLQVFLFRKLILSIEDPIYSLVYISWAVALSIFIGIFVLTSRNSCYLPSIAGSFSIITYLLFAFVCYGVHCASPPDPLLRQHRYLI
ncbi:unnamed protein product [Rotaria socialis]|uniref:Uncharacterized protein n=1 Tax=Rotaria socialis TaxID=392032 RepID=A0A818MQC7_9BILA|nr:unnamed protein product [Rotaria socialis]CAF3416936.1 unnamed protein product [Rotaria socialis]CAF3500144.1 unnamed protein product [Rotaria socialis]CAF3544431.1 unnamed protein product [Rotaria socialis]CAF3592965.1 unnamed protein product [Rotaria socialis]